MKMLVPLTLAAGVIFLCHAACAQTEILQVIPQKSLVAVVAKNADAAEAGFRKMAGKTFGDLPPQGYVASLLQLLKVLPDRRTKADPEVDTGAAAQAATIDLKGPMAVVVVMPALDVQGQPVGVVVRIGDYKKLLQGLASVVGAAAADVTRDGTDVVKGPKDNNLYAAQFGVFAVIADAEYVVKTFKAETKNNLAAPGVVYINQACLLNDLAVYVNVDDAVKAFPNEITAFKQQKMNDLKSAPPEPGELLPAEKMAKVVGALIDLGVEGGRQIDALCYGFKFTPDGVVVTTHVQAAGDSTFARWAATVKPSSLDLLQTLDGPVRAAAAWSIDPEVIQGLQGVLEDFLTRSGLVQEKDKAFVESCRKVSQAALGQGAMLIAAPGEGNGMLRAAHVVSLKGGADVRAALKDCFENSSGFLGAFQGPVKTKTKFEKDMDTYRACSIDKLTVTFEPSAATPEAQEAMKTIEALFGTELVVVLTQVKDNLVYTVGYPSSDALKARVDRLLDGKLGDLAGSADYQAVMSGLPPVRSAVMYGSVSEMLRTVWAGTAGRTDPNVAKALDALKFDKTSAVGLSIGPAEKGVLIQMNVPLQEMKNVMAFYGALTRKPLPATPVNPAAK